MRAVVAEVRRDTRSAVVRLVGVAAVAATALLAAPSAHAQAVLRSGVVVAGQSPYGYPARYPQRGRYPRQARRSRTYPQQYPGSYGRWYPGVYQGRSRGDDNREVEREGRGRWGRRGEREHDDNGRRRGWWNRGRGERESEGGDH